MSTTLIAKPDSFTKWVMGVVATLLTIGVAALCGILWSMSGRLSVVETKVDFLVMNSAASHPHPN